MIVDNNDLNLGHHLRVIQTKGSDGEPDSLEIVITSHSHRHSRRLGHRRTPETGIGDIVVVLEVVEVVVLVVEEVVVQGPTAEEAWGPLGPFSSAQTETQSAPEFIPGTSTSMLNGLPLYGNV
jgi:hypothetical protein